MRYEIYSDTNPVCPCVHNVAISILSMELAADAKDKLSGVFFV